MTSLSHDIRYAARSLLRARALSITVVLALGLGVGATAAMFTVVRGVLLRPMPYAEPERLVTIWTDIGRGREVIPAVSGLDLRDLPAYTTRFDGFAAGAGGDWAGALGVLTGGGVPSERVTVGAVSANFFDVLGVKPLLGRSFNEEETRFVSMAHMLGGPQVVVLSHSLWSRRYRGDKTVVGRSIEVDGVQHQVVGVLPAGFRLHLPSEAFLMRDADLWKPLRINYVTPRSRADAPYTVVARLKRGVTLARGQAELSAVAARLRAEHQVHRDNDLRMRAVPLHHDVVKGVKPVLLLLTLATALFLIIACVNVANLLLARAASREREMATRIAVGASRWKLTRQLLAEGAVLSTLGGVVGVSLALAATQAVRRLSPTVLPRVQEIGVDWAVLAATGAVCLLTTIAFGLAPAAQVAALQLDSLKVAARGSGSKAHARLRGALIGGEIALSLVLLIGAGLLIRSVATLQRIRPGYDVEEILTFRLALPFFKYQSAAARLTAAKEFENRLLQLPGVVSVGAVSQLPLTGSGHFGTITVPGRPSTIDGVTADLRNVTAGYFATLRTRLVAGRFFIPADDSSQGPVAIIDEQLAKQLWPTENAVGKRLTYSVGYVVPDVTIVGVVEHMRLHELTSAGWPQVYVSFYRNPWPFQSYVVRTSLEPEQLVPSIRRLSASVGPYLATDQFRPMSELAADAISSVRFSLLLLQVVGALAAILAAFGLYGVVAYVVGQRTREFGLRLALGATPAELARLVLRESLTLVVVSVGIGIPLAVVGGRLLRGLLFGVQSTDPLTFIAVSAMLIAITASACLLPARRAASVDPLVSLRAE